MLIALSAVGAGDVLQQMKVSSKDAPQETVQSLVNGSVNTWRVRSVFKNATPAVRAALVEQSIGRRPRTGTRPRSRR